MPKTTCASIVFTPAPVMLAIAPISTSKRRRVLPVWSTSKPELLTSILPCGASPAQRQRSEILAFAANATWLIVNVTTVTKRQRSIIACWTRSPAVDRTVPCAYVSALVASSFPRVKGGSSVRHACMLKVNYVSADAQGKVNRILTSIACARHAKIESPAGHASLQR